MNRTLELAPICECAPPFRDFHAEKADFCAKREAIKRNALVPEFLERTQVKEHTCKFGLL